MEETWKQLVRVVGGGYEQNAVFIDIKIHIYVHIRV